MMARYRNRLKIVADVLGVVRGGAKKTQIMYQANLSYKLLARYLKYVMDIGLVRMENEAIYELTQKGREFLDKSKEYFERRKELEQRLGKIRDEKVMLENRFLNTESADACLEDCSKKKGEKERVE